MISALLRRFPDNMAKQYVRLYSYQAPSTKTKKLKRFVPSLDASGRSSIHEVTETKIDEFSSAAAQQRFFCKAMNPRPGQFSILKLHHELMQNYQSANILPKNINISIRKTRLLTMKQIDQVLTATSLIICAPLIYFVIKQQVSDEHISDSNIKTSDG